MVPTPTGCASRASRSRLVETKVLQLLLESLAEVVGVWSEDVQLSIFKPNHEVSLMLAHCKAPDGRAKSRDILLLAFAIHHRFKSEPRPIIGKPEVMYPPPDHLNQCQ